MESKNSISQIDSVLLDVRKAYRLLYIYQKRVLDIMQFIGNQTSREYKGGWSKFSDSTPKEGKGALDLWAWDWLNMYCYEFYFGDKIINEDKIELSVWLISDTGFYDNESIDALNIESYSSVENSKTKLIFVIGKNTWHSNFPDFNINFKKDANDYVRIDDNGTLLAKSFPLSNFLNTVESKNCLKSVELFCERNGIKEMTLK